MFTERKDTIGEVYITCSIGRGDGWQNANSDDSLNKRRAADAMRHGTERVCEGCGASFVAWRSGVSDQRRGRFCSRACSSTYACHRKHLLFGNRGDRNPNWKGGISKQPVRYTSKFKAANPEKAAAHRVLREAVKRGDVARPGACSACGIACKAHGHHDDYAKPLVVRWLCQLCHNAHHAAIRRLNAQAQVLEMMARRHA
jgi:hypothetical protein